MTRTKQPARKRAAPQYFFEEHPPKKQAATSSTAKLSSQWIFLAVKTDQTEEGFYLARGRRSDFEGYETASNKEYSIKWLTRISPNSSIYKYEFNDKIHVKMIIGEVELEATSNANRLRLPAKEKRRLMSDASSSEESDNDSEDEEEGEKEAKPAKRKAPTKRKSKEGNPDKPKRTKKEKKEKPKKPKRLPKNYVVPNAELVPNVKVKPLPDNDLGFLSSPTSGTVSGFTSSKLLIKAVLKNDLKLVQQLLNDPAKCPVLKVNRSVDIERNALEYAFISGNIQILKAIVKFQYGKNAPKRPPLEAPMLSSISSGQYNFRSLGIPFIRDVMMSRGGREGINALTGDEHDYNPGDDPEFAEIALKNNIPLDRLVELQKAISEANADSNTASNMSYGGSYGGSYGRGKIRPRTVSDEIFERYVEKIDYVMIHGHWELAGKLVKMSKSRDYYDTFNYLHVAALTETDVKKVGPIRAASVTKKTMKNFNISPLHCAAINPNPEFLKQFLAVTPDYNITDKKGRRPIHFAAACQSSGPLKVLLSSGVPYFEPDAQGGTPLIYACTVGRVENVKLLLEQAKKDSGNSSGVQDDQMSAASQAVIAKYGPCAINKTGRDGKGALHVAAANLNLEIVKLLVENGADVDFGATSEKRTALMVAAAQGSLPIVKYLIEQGKALIERRDRKSRTALIFAVKNGHANIVAYLLNKGSNPNSADTSGNHAVHYAVAYGWLDCLNLLLQAGANLSVENDWNLSPLAVSFLKGHIGITRELLSRPETDVNFRDKNGRTLVMLTCQSPISEPLLSQLEFLITQMKADAKLSDIYGCNALHFLAMSSNGRAKRLDGTTIDLDAVRTKMAKLLLDNGCSASQKNAANLTPCSVALDHLRHGLVELLLNKGGEITCDAPEQGSNVMHKLATTGISQDCSKLFDLLKKKASKDVVAKMMKQRDDNGQSPLRLAALSYQQANAPYNVAKDSDEYQDWIKRAQEVLRRMVDDFGADPNEPLEIFEKKKRIREDSDDESCSSDSSGSEEENSDDEDEDEEKSVHPVHRKTTVSVAHCLLLPQNLPPYVEFIRKYKPPLNEYDSSGRTLAIATALSGKTDNMRIALELGVDLNLVTKTPYEPVGATPLLAAALNSKWEMVQFLLENDKKSDKFVKIPKTGDDLACLLCKQIGEVDRRLKCLETLGNFDVNTQNNAGRSLLMLAIGSNSRNVDSSNSVEQFLLSRGANCHSIKDQHGRNAFHWLFHSNTGPETAVLTSEPVDPVDLLNALLHHLPQGQTVDTKDNEGRTPLHYAAASGATICVLRLLARGANIDAEDLHGDTPLALAVKNQRKAVVLVLVQSKPKFDVTVENLTPEKPDATRIEWLGARLRRQGRFVGHPLRIDLFSAVIKMHWQGLTSLLIDTLVEKDQQILFTLTALALTSGTYNLALSLLERGKDSAETKKLLKSKTDRDGRNLFHSLALGATLKTIPGDVLKVAGVLAELGCDPITKDDFQCLPLHYACLNQNQHIIKYLSELKELKSVKSMVDRFGRTPIHALFWNLTDNSSFFRVQQLVEVVSKVDSGLDKIADFAPLQHSVPPTSQDSQFSRSSYFERYQSNVQSCLIRAVQTGNYRLVAATLQAGASATVKSDSGLSPIAAAIEVNSVECFLILLSPKLEKSVLDAKNVYEKLENSIIIKFLKPFSEGGLQATPRELQQKIELCRPGGEKPAEAPQVAFGFAAGGLVSGQVPLHADDESADSAESEAESAEDQDLSDDDGDDDAVAPASMAKLPSISKAPLDKKLPYLVPEDCRNLLQVIRHQMYEGRTWKGWESNLNFLDDVEMPENERKLDLLAVDSKRNSALHLAYLSQFRDTFETRFMAKALLSMEKRLENLRNADGKTPADILNDFERPKLQRAPSSVSKAKNADAEIEKISVDWVARMEKFADKKREHEKPDPDKELKPDRRFASYTTSKIVRDEECEGRPFDALMTKIDLHHSGWAEFNFYQLQLIRMTSTGLFVVFTRWGRIGTDGMYQQTPFKVFKDAETEFCKIFKQKSGNDWRKNGTPDTFQVIPKRYRLVTLDRPDKFKQLTQIKIDLKIGDNSALPPPVFELTKSIIQESLNSINDGTIFQRLSNIHLTPFGLVAPKALKDALVVLKKLKEITDNLANNSRKNPMSRDEKFAEYEKIAKLSEEYYHIIPRSGFAYAEVYPLTDSNEVWREIKKIDVLLNLQASTRLLLAAEQHKATENPCDFALANIGMGITVLDPSSDEAQNILRYVEASWPPSNDSKSKVEAIFKLERPKEVEQQAKTKLSNHRLLWHGTKIQNLLGIFSAGLMSSPEGVQHCGQLYGDGIYLADTFLKSVNYCDNIPNKPNYMLLCDVALGEVAYIDQQRFCPNAIGPCPQSCNTLFTSSQIIPDAQYTASLLDNNTTVRVPLGGRINTDSGQRADNNYNFTEFIVKDSKQIAIKYLVKFVNK